LKVALFKLSSNVAIMLGDNPCQHEFDLVLRLLFV
jgi:hypothetical protein